MDNGITVHFRTKTFVLKRLAFLGEFLQSVNCDSTKLLGQITGTSYQNIILHLERDDMSMKRIHQIIEHFGYRITFRLDKETEKPIMLVKETDTRLTFYRNNEYYYYRLNDVNKNKRLYFLKFALKKYNIRIKDLAEANIVSRPTCADRFEKDDCPFSYILQIAEKFDFKLYINIIKTKEEQETTTS